MDERRHHLQITFGLLSLDYNDHWDARSHWCREDLDSWPVLKQHCNPPQPEDYDWLAWDKVITNLTERSTL